MWQKSLDAPEYEQKRETAMSLSAEYPVETVCKELDYPVSSFYYQRRQMEAAAAPNDSEVRQQIQDIAAAYPTYGYRCMASAEIIAATTAG